jgi:hypothetical protein
MREGLMSRRQSLGKSISVIAAAVAGFVDAAPAADVVSSWIGPSTGAASWSVTSNWSNSPPVAQFPNNGNGGFTYDAIVTPTPGPLGTLVLTEPITLQRLTLDSVGIAGNHDIVINEHLHWMRADMGGVASARTTILPGATVLFDGEGEFRRNLTRTFDNFGVATWLSGGFTGNAFQQLGQFNNKPGATFYANSTFIPMGSFGIGTFFNEGLVIKTAGVEARWGGINNFQNLGTLNVQTGTVYLVGGLGNLGTTGVLNGGTYIIDSTNSPNGALLKITSNPILTILPGTDVEMIGGSASIDIIGPVHTNQGRFRIAGGRHFATAGSFSNAGTVTVGQATALKVSGDLNNTGTIDVSGGLLVDYQTNSPLDAIEAQIANARHGGAWDQSGLTSTAARNASPRNTTLGAMEGSDYQAIYGAGATFFGFVTDSTSVVVKYTYYGDTDFNGKVNFDDYVRTDAGFNNHHDGWINGDFDLNGQVNFDDYVLIDLAFNTQSGTLGRARAFLDGTDKAARGFEEPALRMVQQHFQLFGQDFAQKFLAAVPEPGTLLLTGVAASAAMSRRYRRPS